MPALPRASSTARTAPASPGCPASSRTAAPSSASPCSTARLARRARRAPGGCRLERSRAGPDLLAEPLGTAEFDAKVTQVCCRSVMGVPVRRGASTLAAGAARHSSGRSPTIPAATVRGCGSGAVIHRSRNAMHASARPLMIALVAAAAIPGAAATPPARASSHAVRRLPHGRSFERPETESSPARDVDLDDGGSWGVDLGPVPRRQLVLRAALFQPEHEHGQLRPDAVEGGRADGLLSLRRNPAVADEEWMVPTCRSRPARRVSAPTTTTPRPSSP